MPRSQHTNGFPAQLARRILRTVPAAHYVGVAPGTLEKWRTTGVGPKFLRLGNRAIGYDVQDLNTWIDRQRKCTVEGDDDQAA